MFTAIDLHIFISYEVYVRSMKTIERKGELRDRIITARVTENEYKKLHQIAEEYGTTTSSFIRKSMLSIIENERGNKK